MSLISPRRARPSDLRCSRQSASRWQGDSASTVSAMTPGRNPVGRPMLRSLLDHQPGGQLRLGALEPIDAGVASALLSLIAISAQTNNSNCGRCASVATDIGDEARISDPPAQQHDSVGPTRGHRANRDRREDPADGRRHSRVAPVTRHAALATRPLFCGWIFLAFRRFQTPDFGCNLRAEERGPVRRLGPSGNRKRASR
jgi:hypothetical protein